MYDLRTARRRSRWMLAFTLSLLAGALSLFVMGYRGPVGWAVLLSCTVNLFSVIIGRRALARLDAASARHDAAGDGR